MKSILNYFIFECIKIPHFVVQDRKLIQKIFFSICKLSSYCMIFEHNHATFAVIGRQNIIHVQDKKVQLTHKSAIAFKTFLFDLYAISNYIRFIRKYTRCDGNIFTHDCLYVR